MQPGRRAQELAGPTRAPPTQAPSSMRQPRGVDGWRVLDGVVVAVGAVGAGGGGVERREPRRTGLQTILTRRVPHAPDLAPERPRLRGITFVPHRDTYLTLRRA